MSELKVKIGDAEFVGVSNDEQLLDARYNKFLEALEKRGGVKTAPPKAQSDRPHDDGGEEDGGEDDGGRFEDLGGDNGVVKHNVELKPIIERVFLREKDGISLRVLPTTEKKTADALMLILYGYQVLANEPAVLGTRLVAAAMQSGVQIDRVDKALASRGEFITKGGFRRGSKYGLNNRGVVAAEDLLRNVLK